MLFTIASMRIRILLPRYISMGALLVSVFICASFVTDFCSSERPGQQVAHANGSSAIGQTMANSAACGHSIEGSDSAPGGRSRGACRSSAELLQDRDSAFDFARPSGKLRDHGLPSAGLLIKQKNSRFSQAKRVSNIVLSRLLQVLSHERAAAVRLSFQLLCVVW